MRPDGIFCSTFPFGTPSFTSNSTYNGTPSMWNSAFTWSTHDTTSACRWLRPVSAHIVRCSTDDLPRRFASLPTPLTASPGVQSRSMGAIFISVAAVSTPGVSE